MRYPFLVLLTSLAIHVAAEAQESTVQKAVQETGREQATAGLEMGFAPADANNDGSVSESELRTYLDDRLGDEGLPLRKIFKRLDKDKSKSLSAEEFDARRDVIKRFMGQGYFDALPEPEDPGPGYVPFQGLSEPIDDKSIFGAVYHRYYDLIDNGELTWPKTQLDAVPKVATKAIDAGNASEIKSSLEQLVDATVILAGGGDNFFSSGAVVISSNGLAITNYHVAEAMADSKLVAMTARGKSHRVIEFVAGNRERDVALIRLEGNEFTAAKIALSNPKFGDDIVMIHHSENRFYTYDRGYVMRHPKLGKHPWMEVSTDYAPGGSGCGIFNANHELVGLVAIIQYGDGPSMADGFDEALESDVDSSSQGDEGYDEAVLLVKHAVSLRAIRSLWE